MATYAIPARVARPLLEALKASRTIPVSSAVSTDTASHGPGRRAPRPEIDSEARVRQHAGGLRGRAPRCQAAILSRDESHLQRSCFMSERVDKLRSLVKELEAELATLETVDAESQRALPRRCGNSASR